MPKGAAFRSTGIISTAAISSASSPSATARTRSRSTWKPTAAAGFRSGCGRFRFAAPLEDGRIAAIRVVNGEAEVVLLDSRGGLERPLYRAAPGEALTGIAAVRGTVVVTSLRNERWSLVEIAEGKSSV